MSGLVVLEGDDVHGWADAAAANLVRPCLLHITGDYWGWFGSRSYHHTGMVSLWYASEDPVFARLIAD